MLPLATEHDWSGISVREEIISAPVFHSSVKDGFVENVVPSGCDIRVDALLLALNVMPQIAADMNKIFCVKICEWT